MPHSGLFEQRYNLNAEVMAVRRKYGVSRQVWHACHFFLKELFLLLTIDIPVYDHQQQTVHVSNPGCDYAVTPLRFMW